MPATDQLHTSHRAETRAIATAAPVDEAAVIDVVTLAFGTDPVARWVYPDPHRYAASMPRFVRAFAGKAFAHGSAHYLEGYAGAAMWLPPGVHPEEDELISVIERSVSHREKADFLAVAEQMGSWHPDEPHWYLPLIGVDPIHQGRGCGSALLRHALVACDSQKAFAYLENSNPRNTPLYQRHGFELLGTIQAGASPPLYPMLREPR